MVDTFTHNDQYRDLESSAPLSEKLTLLHNMLRKQHDCIDRIAIALYDPKQDILKTFAWSSEQESPLTSYQAKLSECASLVDILEKDAPRVVNDMDIFEHGTAEHTRLLRDVGFGSSYTLPMYRNNEFLGFIFFNSFNKNAFTESLLNELDMAGHMISFLVSNEQNVLDTLHATLRTAMGFTHQRDPETAGHIDRMSRFARLIARKLSGKYGFDDQFIEHIFLFSPLHDIGKIGIPDSVLLKRGKLDKEEYELMKSHSIKGRDMIDALLKNYGLDGVSYVEMLRNIAMHHHEAYDGSGYPLGLKADDIPIEARIVTVADVFDALTSKRPYKDAWSNEKAIETITALRGSVLDADCVDALINNMEEIEQIQQSFKENPIG